MVRFALFVTFSVSVGLAVQAFSSVAGAAGPSSSWTDRLNYADSSRWTKADGWSNGIPFDVGWRADHVSFSRGQMTLTLDTKTCPNACSDKPYASGEYRTNEFYGFGRYEVRMKAAVGTGLVSSFFTYSDPYARPGVPWDEIDIEILGKDPTKLQVNYVTSGVGGHEATLDLGFDASLDFHTYAFEWSSGKIAWYVDGVLKHTEDGAHGPLPVTPGRIIMNLWAGTGVDAWLGAFTYGGPEHAYYEQVWFTSSPTANKNR